MLLHALFYNLSSSLYFNWLCLHLRHSVLTLTHWPLEQQITYLLICRSPCTLTTNDSHARLSRRQQSLADYRARRRHFSGDYDGVINCAGGAATVRSGRGGTTDVTYQRNSRCTVLPRPATVLHHRHTPSQALPDIALLFPHRFSLLWAIKACAVYRRPAST